MLKLILGSTSPYRKELLQKLQIPFITAKPLVDEETEKKPRFSPLELAQHLAKIKAQSLRKKDALIIGGDQLIALDGVILGKPHTLENAEKQLFKMQNNTHELITAVHLCSENEDISFVNITRMKMKPLTTQQIQAYLKLDHPLDCAGSYKIEKHGIALMDSIETTDFTAIQGLPLLELAQHLQHFGFQSFQGEINT